MSTTSVPGRQSANRATIVPCGSMRAARPGKSSSTFEPACPVIATQRPCSRAWRTASRSPHPSHQSRPARQPASSVLRPDRPGAEQKKIRGAPACRAWRHGKSTPPSAQMAMANQAPPRRKTFAWSPGVKLSSPSPRWRLRYEPWSTPAVCVQLRDEEPVGGSLGDPEDGSHAGSAVASTTWATAGDPTGIAAAGCSLGSIDPVSENSGKTATSQPERAPASRTSMCAAALSLGRSLL